MTILATDGLVPLANADYVTAGAYRKIVAMYSGPMPTKEQFEAAMFSTVAGSGIQFSTTRGTYSLTLLNQWAIALGNTLRAWCRYENTLQGHHIGPTKFRFPLSERSEEFTRVSGGTVNWFLFATCAAATVDMTSNQPAYFVGIGTIGDVGSSEDMVLSGGAVDINKVLKGNDLVFNYTWGG